MILKMIISVNKEKRTRKRTKEKNVFFFGKEKFRLITYLRIVI